MRRVLFLAVIVACKSDEARDAHPPIPAMLELERSQQLE